MPQPIYNIVYSAGLDVENMGAIENTTTNVKKIKDAFRKKWEDKVIPDKDICNGLIDYKGAPDWIKESVEQERLLIQQVIEGSLSA